MNSLTGVWWHTGRKRPALGASTPSRSHLWTSSMTYLRARAFAWASSPPTTKVNWCKWFGPRSATASSSAANLTACGCITGVATPYSSSQPHWTTPTPVRCSCIKYSPGFPSRPSTLRRREAYSGPTTTSSASSHGRASPSRSVS